MLRQLIKAVRNRDYNKDALPGPLKAIAISGLNRLHAHYHARQYRRMVSPAGLSDFERQVCEQTIPVRAPVALISQIERSGGTLLSQLFDGHPQVAAYPHELRFGIGTGDIWPENLPTFRDAADLKMRRLMKHGFRKGRHGDAQRFLLSPRIQKLIFDRIDKPTPRDSFDAFFTAFFNAWLNYSGDLRETALITAFAPRVALDDGNLRRFFAAYPDGYLIQVERDFSSWRKSAAPFYAAQGRPVPDARLRELWLDNAVSQERNRKTYGDRVLTVRFDELRSDPRTVMAFLSRRLGLENNEMLHQPTFNGRLSWANSSFQVAAPGLIPDPSECAAAAPRKTAMRA